MSVATNGACSLAYGCRDWSCKDGGDDGKHAQQTPLNSWVKCLSQSAQSLAW